MNASSNALLEFPDHGQWSGIEGFRTITNDFYLEVFGDRVYFRGKPRPTDQMISDAGGYWDETAHSYYVFVEQTETLVKLAKPYADVRMPITGSIQPGSFFTFDAMESFVVKVDEAKNEAYLVIVHHRDS